MYSRALENFSSFDYQLFFTFFISMMLQTPLPINGIARISLTALWIGVLLRFAIRHRRKHQWQWQGLTLLALIKSVGTLSFGLWCLASFIAAAVNGFIYRRDWTPTPSRSWEAFPEATRVLPDLLISKNPIVSFCLIACIGLIFSTLVDLRVAYLSEQKFLKDCQKKDILNLHYHKQMPEFHQERRTNLIKTVIAFFTSRPFMLQKYSDSIRIEFYKISSQDLQANFALFSIPLLFFIFSLFGLTQVVLALPSYLNSSEGSEYLPIVLILLGWGLQVLFLALFPYLIWNRLFRLLFIKRIIDFKVDELVVGEIAFGRYRKLFSIRRTGLLPLKQKAAPEVINAALLIQHRGKDVELAGHLLPEAMKTVQQVYDRYRTSTFSSFYCETQSVYLK